MSGKLLGLEPANAAWCATQPQLCLGNEKGGGGGRATLRHQGPAGHPHDREGTGDPFSWTL